MANQNSKTLILSKSAIREKEGVVILPLKKWKKVEKENQELRLAVGVELVVRVEGSNDIIDIAKD